MSAATKDQIAGSLALQLANNNVTTLIQNLADASVQIQELTAKIADLEKAMDKAPSETIATPAALP